MTADLKMLLVTSVRKQDISQRCVAVKLSTVGHHGSQAGSTGGRGNSRRTHQISEHDGTSQTEMQDTSYNLFHVVGKRSRADPINVTVNVNGENIAMEIDTGAHYSLISESTYHKTWSDTKPPLEPVSISLQTYTGEKLTVLGSII